MCSLMLRLGSGNKISLFIAGCLVVFTNRSHQRSEDRRGIGTGLILSVLPFLVYIASAAALPPGCSSFLCLNDAQTPILFHLCRDTSSNSCLSGFTHSSGRFLLWAYRYQFHFLPSALGMTTAPSVISQCYLFILWGLSQLSNKSLKFSLEVLSVICFPKWPFTHRPGIKWCIHRKYMYLRSLFKQVYWGIIYMQ